VEIGDQNPMLGAESERKRWDVRHHVQVAIVRYQSAIVIVHRQDGPAIACRQDIQAIVRHQGDIVRYHIEIVWESGPTLQSDFVNCNRAARPQCSNVRRRKRFGFI